MKQLCWGTVLTFLLLSTTVKSGYTYTVDEVFENFKKAYEKSQNFSAEFEETTFRTGTKSSARGQLTFSKPNLLRKKYVGQKDPTHMVQVIVLDGAYSWSYTPMLNQVNKMKWNNPNRRELLPGIGASLQDVQKNYNMKLIVDEVANLKGIYQIELTPKPHMLPESVDDAPPPRETLEIWIRREDWLPMQFGYNSESDIGNDVSVVVSLTNIQRDQELDSGLFNFVIPDGVEVIDLSSEE
jgi:outer membrane lipoprotein-sorting protein